MKTVAWLSLVAAAVAAQNGIPSGVTDSCNGFLQSFNKDTKIQACLNPLITATARFLPSSGLQSNKGDVTWALDQLAAGKGACTQSYIQTTVTNFYSACQSDLTSGNQPYLETTFELLYLTIPIINAAVSKDNDGTYCVSKAKKAGGHTKRADQASLQINVDDWKKSHVQYLFINPDESTDQLCTFCTKQIMTSYISYENVLPFPMGIRASQLLADQKAIWSAINSKCPSDFAAGILSSSNATPIDVSNVAAGAGGTNAGSNTVLSTTGLIGALMAVAATLA